MKKDVVYPTMPDKVLKRQYLMMNIARNYLERDLELLNGGYVPIDWLLADITYNEATEIKEIILRWEDTKKMSIKKGGWFGI